MKSIWKNSVVGFLLILSGVVRGQETFHNIYFFDDSVAVISDIFPTDSGYYFSASENNNTTLRTESIFGKLKVDGSIDFFVRNIDPNSNQYVSFCRTQMEKDYLGRFVFSALNASGGSAPRVLKYDALGTKQVDSIYQELWSVDSLELFGSGRIITSVLDSSIYLYFTYYDELNDDDGAVGNTGESGVLFAKLDENGNFIWQKRIAHPSSANFKPQYSVLSAVFISDTTLLLTIREFQNEFPNSQTWAKVHFFEFDTDGNELANHSFQDTQFNYGQYGLLKTDSSVIYSHLISEYHSQSLSWRYRSAITCLNASFEQKWKDTLIPKFVLGDSYQSPQKLIHTSDTTFAGAFTYEYAYVNEDTTFFYLLFPIELFNKDLETGEDVWVRNYRYFPEDSARRYQHEIIDIERTYDDGYIMCGSVISKDSLQANRPAQYGYVIKTNCLGFLGDPEVAASYSFGEENTVLFHNESIQAGSYQWDFGDGTILTTGEDTTLPAGGHSAILHEYSATGIYTIQLIGYGCNGKSDTLTFTINFEYTEPGYAGDGTLLTLYPNPVSTGSSLAFYIGNLSEGNHHLNVFNSLGQRVDHFPITDANTNYLYPIDYAAGMYIFRLESNGEVAEIEKLVVE